jgi:hypothetical protein
MTWPTSELQASPVTVPHLHYTAFQTFCSQNVPTSFVPQALTVTLPQSVVLSPCLHRASHLVPGSSLFMCLFWGHRDDSVGTEDCWTNLMTRVWSSIPKESWKQRRAATKLSSDNIQAVAFTSRMQTHHFLQGNSVTLPSYRTNPIELCNKCIRRLIFVCVTSFYIFALFSFILKMFH